jgi:hypothetical protein
MGGVSYMGDEAIAKLKGALIGIMSERYGGGMTKLLATWTGKTDTGRKATRLEKKVARQDLKTPYGRTEMKRTRGRARRGQPKEKSDNPYEGIYKTNQQLIEEARAEHIAKHGTFLNP